MRPWILSEFSSVHLCAMQRQAQSAPRSTRGAAPFWGEPATGIIVIVNAFSRTRWTVERVAADNEMDPQKIVVMDRERFRAPGGCAAFSLREPLPG